MSVYESSITNPKKQLEFYKDLSEQLQVENKQLKKQLEKYENEVVSGGKIFVDSTMIDKKVDRTDVDVYYIPATKMANDNGTPTLANMIITGKILKEVPQFSIDYTDDALKKVVSARHLDLLDVNKGAVKAGYDYE